MVKCVEICGFMAFLRIRLCVLRKGLTRTSSIVGMGCLDHQSYSIGKGWDSYRVWYSEWSPFFRPANLVPRPVPAGERKPPKR